MSLQPGRERAYESDSENPRTLYLRLRARGIKVVTDGARVGIKGEIGKEEWERIRDHKSGLLDILLSEDPGSVAIREEGRE